MMENEDDYNYEEEKLLVSRYEEMKRHNEQLYFDEDEFEAIIDYYSWKNDIVDALSAVDTAQKFYPKSTEFQLRKIDLLIAKNDARGALKLIESVEELMPDNTDIFLLKAKALLNMNNVKSAIYLFDKTLQMNADGKNELLVTISGMLIDCSEYRYAIKYLQQSYEINDKDIDVLSGMAYCYERLNDLENSCNFYKKYLDESPLDDMAWYSLGCVYTRRQMFNQAIEAYDYAIAVNSKYLAAYYNKADALVAQEKFDKAIDAYNEYLNLDPENLQAKCAIGECYEKQKNYEKAVDIYSEIINADNKFANAYYGMAVVLAMQEKTDEALTYAKKAIAIDDTNSEYWFGLGKIYLHQNKTGDETIHVFQKAVELDPYDYESWLVIVELLASKDTDTALDKSIETLETAYKYNYDIPEVCYRLAATYYIANNMEKCLPIFEKALNEDFSMSNDFFEMCPKAKNDVQIMEVYLTYKMKN